MPQLNKSKTSENRSTSAHATFTDKCTFCATIHFIVRCDAFKNKTVSERKDFVNKKKLYVKCLGFHPLRNCRSEKRCTACNSRRHTLLQESTNSSAHVATPGTIHNHVPFTGLSFAVKGMS